jgi:predicted CXXCH cytochrome family protein
MNEAVHYTNAHWHANTETIVGHVSQATGSVPAAHGMVGNIWHDRELGRLVYNIEDADYRLLSADASVDHSAEIGVGCEACHGPGETHVAWSKAPDTFDKTRWSDVDALGLTAVYQTPDTASQINLCAACHSRREPLGSDSPIPGAAFDQHYRLALLRDDLYFPDGQIKDEVDVYGSFLQSRMYAKGVQCGDCHDAHTSRVKLKGNALCTQCHNPQGNPRFPGLEKNGLRHDKSSFP